MSRQNKTTPNGVRGSDADRLSLEFSLGFGSLGLSFGLSGSLCSSNPLGLSFLKFFCSLHLGGKAINTTFGVDNLLFTSEEWVAR